MKEVQYISGDFLVPRDAWDKLSIEEQAAMMKTAISEGILDLGTIRQKYNEFAEGGNTDDDLVDWIIREEGFLANPQDIGDGKMTLGSGLTAQKWHDQYKRNGNKWTSSDNRRAVREEVANRRRWAEKNIPNWDSLPSSSQKALLSYKYNYDFNRTNSPKLFKALADSNLQEAARQMDATSSNAVFRKGLQERRQREQEWFLRDVVLPQVPDTFYQPAVSTQVYNPYVQQVESTRMLPINEPDPNSYIRTREISPQEQRRRKFQENVEAYQRFNALMNLIDLRNNPAPSYNPIYSLIGGDPDEYANGGKIHIKPENRGKFTALKERTGHSATWFKEHGTPAQKKMATFALNARKWKHSEGGPLVDMAMNSYAPGGNIVYGHPYYSYDENGQLVRDENGKPILNYNATLPDIVITPDSKKSPAERAVLEMERRRNHEIANGQGTYNTERAKEWTRLQQLIAQKEWENSLEKQALDYAQAATTGIGIGADIVSGLPIYSSLKGARVLSEAKTPTDYIEGGLWLTPITGGIYHTAKPAISKTANHIVNQAQSIGREMGNPFEFAEGIYNYARREPIPFAEKEAAAQRMDAFIHSPEYIQKQKAAGLSDSEIADFQDMIARRLNGGNFPAYRMKRKSNGLSLSLPKPFGGIYMRKGIPADDFLNAFDHEVAHYSTVNFGKTDNELLKWLNNENPTVMEKVMEYNINSVPYRPKADVSKVRTARGLSPDTEKLNYFRDEQELRSNAYAMLQEAQRRGISVDELVDQYTMQSTGEIFGHAPAPLRYLNYAYTPENMKKFIKSFLSVSTPVTIEIKATTQNDNE